jgi:hypothetical protein
MTDTIEYSPEALNVRNNFFEVDAIVYVEGVDDKLFWPKIFSKFSGKVFLFEDVGGKPELLKKIKILKENNSRFIVATDLDYSFFIEEGLNHSNVITTYGHSIENTLIQKSSIIEIVENSSDINKGRIISLYEDFYENINSIIGSLLHIDIFCSENNIKSIIGKNVGKFAKSKKTYCICDKKIITHKSSIDIPNELECKENLNFRLASLRFTSLDLINGHFLLSSLLRFVVINSEGFRESLKFSSDSLLTTLLISFKNIFDSDHPHYSFYQSEVSKIENIVESFN